MPNLTAITEYECAVLRELVQDEMKKDMHRLVDLAGTDDEEGRQQTFDSMAVLASIMNKLR